MFGLARRNGNGHVVDSAVVSTEFKNGLPERPEDNDPVTRTHLVNTQDETRHDVTTLDGHKVTVDNTDTETSNLTGSFDDRVMSLIKSFDNDRQRKEDIRAKHRNFNRFATLLFTLFAGLAITYGLYHGWFGPFGPKIGPYSFVITVAGDTVLTAYAFIKNY